MEVYENKQTIIDYLYNIYKEKGFVTEETILEVTTQYNVPLEDIDNICDTFLSMGGLIFDESQKIDDETDFIDYTHTDYNSIFKRAISIDNILKPFIEEIQKIPPPKKREFDNLLQQTKNDNDFARERIIKMYLRVVIKFALWHYDNYEMPLAEAVQDACTGLLTALEKCDIDKHGLFTRYAPWYIRQKIIYYAPSRNPLLYFPLNIKVKLNKIQVLIKQFCEKCPCDNICNTVIEKISKQIKSDEEEVKLYIDYLKEIESIDNLLNSNEDIFTDEGLFEKDLLSYFENINIKTTISNILNILNEQEKTIITSHYGLLDNKECSLEELGQKFNLTRERIRQIELIAFRKIRNLPNITKLKRLLC